MKFHNILSHGVLVFGDMKFRGKCPIEDVEQATFFAWIRRVYPGTYGALAIHPRNEGMLRGGQFYAMRKIKAEGMTPGSSDIIIPGRHAFVCEMKRADHTKSTWQPNQEEYLIAAAKAGSFACVALGHTGAIEAVQYWIEKRCVSER